MPKLIDYPRTSYTGAWELAEIIDDTGGKCAIETAARKLNRKVSGSFKAIIGSAVKFGLMTSKRDLLTTTTLFRRIKHAYDKAEELQFHREAFLTPPLFTQLCRKFRNRELPVQMLDVMLIREFGVEEINAQSVAKAFVDGCRMCGLMDEANIIADIDALNNRTPRRELASPVPETQTFKPNNLNPTKPASNETTGPTGATDPFALETLFAHVQERGQSGTAHRTANQRTTEPTDAVANLFGISESISTAESSMPEAYPTVRGESLQQRENEHVPVDRPISTDGHVVAVEPAKAPINPMLSTPRVGYQMQMSGPGVNTSLDITDEDDITIAIALLEKIRRQLRAN